MPLLGLKLSESPVQEKTTIKITGRLVDESAAVLAAASLTTLTVTLYDKETGAIINLRDDTNILNTNGGTVDANGNLAWTMDPADNPISDATLHIEKHIALFEWTWTAGAKADKEEFEIPVRNMAKVT